jgi:hypothetical protein
VFTARNRQNAFAERRRKAREARAAETPQPASEPTAVPYDTRNDASDGVTDAPDVSTYGVTGQAVIGPPSDIPYTPVGEGTTDTPDVATLAPGGVVEPIDSGEDVEIERGEAVIPLSSVSADTRAKVDAVLNGAIDPVASDLPLYAVATSTGPEGHTLGLDRDSAPVLVEQLDTPAEPKRGRGRPRPQETIDRDNAVHALLVGADPDTGISKESIAAELDEKEQQVYSSLRQLTKEGRAETRYVKPHGYRWFAI